MNGHCDHDHHRNSLGRASLIDALETAAQFCAERGERLTEPRRRVLELLLDAGQPMKAYDLIPVAGEAGAPVKPPTVYRALEFLQGIGLVHRIESLNSFVACQASPNDHRAVFFICTCCGASRETALPADLDLEALGSQSGFTVRHVMIEARGLCGDCKA